MVNNIKFDSKKEARRYGQLLLLQRAGEISNIELQPVFPVVLNDKKICKYKADFAYMEKGERVIEDVKSPITAKNPLYRLKKKLVEALHRVQIREL